LGDFYAAFPEDYNRERTAWFDKGPEDTQRAANAARDSIRKGYEPQTNNCAHTCWEALNAAGIKLPKGGEDCTGYFLTPYEVLEMARNAKGQSPPESIP
jgi:hypothetical protein